MDDIIAVEVIDKKHGTVAFLTWGRVFHRTNPEPLLRAVSRHLHNFGLSDILKLRVCNCLQEVSSHPYFFEALLAVGRKPIPFGKRTYKLWAAKTRRAITEGRELYFLGKPTEAMPKTKGPVAKRTWIRHEANKKLPKTDD